MEERIYSVSEIARDIKRVIEQFLAPVWIEGEVTNFVISRVGHIYFSLKDQNAILNCTVWRGQAASIPFQIVNGMRLLVFGNVTTYAMQSQYQLNVQQIRAAGLGSLYLAFETLKKKLTEEGLFASERKRPLTAFPTRIGLITSQSGAALRDFLQISRRRNPAVEIVLYPAMVQGRTAAATIIHGLEIFNRQKNVDFIVVTRGGGSLEDLWTFNEEALVRAVAKSELPVVSAIGHEVDFTLCDFAADLRAPTPSAAAEMTIPERTAILQQIDQNLGKIAKFTEMQITGTRTSISNLTKRLILNRPLELLRQRSQRVDDLESQIIKTTYNRLQTAKVEVENLRKTLEVLNPRAILERGYAIVYKLPDKQIVNSVNRVKPDTDILIEVRDGEFQAQTGKIYPIHKDKK